ncbi:MAG: asparagine synthase (glutamine-hydrolyzing) [Chloroflexota bacterium]|nr:asparagine synthase (glutamine-hydrolyzing) [Chloroflexota bacterium]
MCGIAGYFGKKPPTEELLRETLSLMKNRGPDHQASRSFSIGEFKVTLLHSRLSVIDLDPRSNQPFTIGNLTVVYNGEIYNYIELRQQLIERGIELQTQSDTEVLLHFYRLYGEDCVQHFEGMWAFAVFDAEDGLLFLSRDRFAEKPLYYINDKCGFYFGSEIKFLKGLTERGLKVNQRHLQRHLMHGYKALYKTDETYFEEVRELKYGQSLTLTPAGVGHSRRYWKPTCKIDESMSLEDAIEESRERLFDSVRIRLRSDVPLAFCLSGGVDSASLVSIAAKKFNKKLETFSIIDSDARYNEEDNIMATVRDVGCSYNLLKIPKEGALARLHDLIAYHDVPLATITYYIHSLITESVSKAGFRVAFSGTSADELFSGYYDHFLLHLNEVRSAPDYQTYLSDWNRYTVNYIRNPIFKTADLFQDSPDYRDHVFDASRDIKKYFTIDFREEFKEEKFCENLMRNRMLNELFHEITPVILHEDDLNSMFNSIENRSPYLDTGLLKVAFSIPPKHLIREGFGKYILRESVKGILNDQVRLDRRKKGFNASINSMIDLQDTEVRAYLLDPKAEIFEIINRKKLEQLFDQFPIPNHLSKFIFNFVNARMFLEMN